MLKIKVFFVKAVAKLAFLGYTIFKKGGDTVNDKITRIKLNAKRVNKKLRGLLSRHFNLNFSLKRKSEPDSPLLAVNVKGEIPREVVAFFAAIGFITAAFAVWKILKRIF